MTGATGGLGSQLTRAILECGGDVIAIDAHEIPLATTWGKQSSSFTALKKKKQTEQSYLHG